MGHNRPVVAAVVVAVGLAGGCAGGDGDPDSSERTSSTDVSVTVPTAPTTAAPTTAAPFPPKVGLAQVARLDEPVAFAVRNGDDALYVAEKKGRVRAVRGGAVDAAAVLDIRGQVSLGNEQGLLGLAFSPDGRHLYIDYTDRDGDTRVVEYAMAGTRADPASRRQLLAVDQPAANHNGGHVVFGPDGFLYIGLGDGGGAGDPDNRAQDRGSLLGKILRIDPGPTATAPTASRRATPSPASPACGPRSGPTGCATRGASPSTATRASCGSATSARARSKRSTASPGIGPASTTAGAGARAPAASRAPGPPGRSTRSTSTAATGAAR